MTAERPELLFFDVNETLLDLTELGQSVSEALNGGPEIVSHWFESLLHYSLVSTACDEFRDFGEIGAAVLVMMATNRNIDLDIESAKKVLEPIRTAPPHPDVPGALETLKEKGYRMAALTNSPRAGMTEQLRNAGISGYFERQLSVEDIGIYKPHRRLYRWAARQLELTPEQCLFIAAHGWDVAGAMSAGMKAAFVSRPGRALYPLAPEPSFIEPDLERLASKL